MAIVYVLVLNQLFLVGSQGQVAVRPSGAEGEGFSVSSKLDKDVVDWNESTRFVVSVRGKGVVKSGPGSINLKDIPGWNPDLGWTPESVDFLWDENDKVWNAEFYLLPQKSGLISIPEIPFSFVSTLVGYPERRRMLVFSQARLLQVKEPQTIQLESNSVSQSGTRDRISSNVLESVIALVLAPISLYLAGKMIRKYLAENLKYQKPGKGGWILRLLVSHPKDELTPLDWMSNLQSYFRTVLLSDHGVLTGREIAGGIFQKYLGHLEQAEFASFFENLEDECFGVNRAFDESRFRKQAIVWVRLLESRR